MEVLLNVIAPDQVARVWRMLSEHEAMAGALMPPDFVALPLTSTVGVRKPPDTQIP
jgi:Mg/Co/Ni transporter MgtE